MTITLTPPHGALRVRLDDFGTTAREMFSQAMLGDTADQVLALCEETFRCEAAGLLLLQNGDRQMVPLAASNGDAARADALQLETRQGPAHQAIARRQPVIATDLRTDSRWRFWAPLAADLGFRSVLSLGLADGDMSGALTLYARRPSHFSSADLSAGQTFAELASIALAIAAEREQLMRAVQTRGIVGQAQGVLMERHHITAKRAGTVLQHYAAHLGQELPVIAQQLVEDQHLPELLSSATTPEQAYSASDAAS